MSAIKEGNQTPLLDLVQRQKIGLFQLGIISCALLMTIVLGVLISAIYFSSISIAKDLGFADSHIGFILCIISLGLCIGITSLSIFIYRINSKLVLILNIIFLGLSAFSMTFITDYFQMVLVQLVCGICTGAILTLLIVFLQEFSLHTKKMLMIWLVTLFYQVGVISVGLLGFVIISDYGWRGLYKTLGVFSVIFLPFLIVAIPKSLHSIVRKPSEGSLFRFNRTLRMMGVSPVKELPEIANEPTNLEKIKLVFSGGFKKVSRLLGTSIFLTFGIKYGTMSLLLTSHYGSDKLGLHSILVLEIGSFVGLFVVALLSKSSKTHYLVTTCALLVSASLLIWYCEGSEYWWFSFCALFGLLLRLLESIVYMSVNSFYPENLFHLAVSLFIGIGAFGAFSFLLVISLCLNAGLSFQFASYALFLLSLVVVIWFMKWNSKRSKEHVKL